MLIYKLKSKFLIEKELLFYMPQPDDHYLSSIYVTGKSDFILIESREPCFYLPAI